MGHDIGLHFDETNYELEQYSGKERNNKLKELILKEKKILEVILDNIEIQSVSMHIPSKETLDANLAFGEELINSYSPEFFSKYKYVSDSEMRWREDVGGIIASNEYNKLHILTHPIWYDKNVISKAEKIKKHLENKKKNLYKGIKVIVPKIEAEIAIDDF